MGQTMKIFKIGLKQILRDGMLLILIPGPFIMGLVFKYIIPLANNIFIKQYNLSLINYYGIFDGILFCMTATFIAMISSLLILEERDEGTGIYYQITPATGSSYLKSRIGIPGIWLFVYNFILGVLFNLSEISIIEILLSSIISGIMGIFFTILIVSMATNRVEGLAYSKFIGISLVGIIVPVTLSNSWQYIVGFLPSFWIGKILFGDNDLIYFTIGIIVCVLWIIIFSRRFNKNII